MSAPRFQLRLSTAIVLMMVVGAILGLNCSKRFELFLSQEGDAYGWPEPFYLASGMKEPVWRFWSQTLIFDVIAWTMLLWLVKFICDQCAKYRGLGFAIRRVHPFSLLLFSTYAAYYVYRNTFDFSDWRYSGWPEQPVPGSNGYWHHFATNISLSLMLPFLAAMFCQRLLTHRAKSAD